MSRKVDYFLSRQDAPIDDTCILVNLTRSLVPAHLNGLSRYLSRAYWNDETEWFAGYQITLLEMESILMPCGEEIVNNLIALRGILPDAPRDEVFGVPIDPPFGTTILSLSQRQGDAITAANSVGDAQIALQEQIRDLIQQGLFDSESDAFLGILLGII